jgi:transmembrane sensor
MEVQDHNIKALLEKYNAGTITDKEKAILDKWYLYVTVDNSEELSDEERLRTFDAVLISLEEVIAEKKTRRLWPRIAAASSILLVLSVTAFFTLRTPSASVQLATVPSEGLAPMNKGVVLKIAGGKQFILGHAQGMLNTADGTKVKQSGRALTYGQTSVDEAPVTHTLTNNNGSKYSLTLADGTEAYLDAASSITYPVVFKGNQRKVSVTGQVYFKVKHNAAMPFYVIVNDETIEDIGTEFNINAYENEAALKTTLIEGSVSVKRDRVSVLLKPGEQTVASGAGLIKKAVDLDETTAWLEGKLIFDAETLEIIMNRVARIYDVNLVWVDQTARKLKFGGSINCTKKLSAVLDFFRETGKVDFTVEGNTVKIFKKK